MYRPVDTDLDSAIAATTIPLGAGDAAVHGELPQKGEHLT